MRPRGLVIVVSQRQPVEAARQRGKEYVPERTVFGCRQVDKACSQAALLSAVHVVYDARQVSVDDLDESRPLGR